MLERPPAAPRSVYSMVDDYGAAIDGYAHAKRRWGSELEPLFEARLRDYRATGVWSGTFEELRCLLFAEQRRMHFDVYYPAGDEARELFDLYSAVCDAWNQLHPDDPVTFIPPDPLPAAGAPAIHVVGYGEELPGKPLIYPRPQGAPVALTAAPELESWNRIGHPDQVRLTKSLDALEAQLAPRLPPGPLALHLHVGLSSSQSLTAAGRDLDNYLLPVTRRLGANRIWSASATKAVGEQSTIIAGTLMTPIAPPDSFQVRTVRCTGSVEREAWKQQISLALAPADMVASEAAIYVHLSFVVAGRRNWTTLWKPAIDALGPILGIPNALRPYRPRDDRIVSLGLHRFVDDALGDDVQITVWWRPDPGVVGQPAT